MYIYMQILKRSFFVQDHLYLFIQATKRVVNPHPTCSLGRLFPFPSNNQGVCSPFLMFPRGCRSIMSGHFSRRNFPFQWFRVSWLDLPRVKIIHDLLSFALPYITYPYQTTNPSNFTLNKADPANSWAISWIYSNLLTLEFSWILPDFAVVEICI